MNNYFRCFCAVLLLVFAGSLAAVDGPVIPHGKGDQCVADTDFMRRNHMDLIVHQRDETVIKGLRDEPFSLVECVACHAQTASDGVVLRVDAEGQFCQSCHAYAAVSIDCFSCHAAVPDSTDRTLGGNPAVGAPMAHSTVPLASQPPDLKLLAQLQFYVNALAENDHAKH